jgi:hypothetical protein
MREFAMNQLASKPEMDEDDGSKWFKKYEN